MSLTPKFEKTLQVLARLHGIELKYRDGMGTDHVVPVLTLQALLQAMEVKVSTDQEARQSLKALRRQSWTRVLDDVSVIWEHDVSPMWQLTLPLPSNELSQLSVNWQLDGEQGSRVSGESSGGQLSLTSSRTIRGKSHCRLGLTVPQNLPLGYYRLTVTASWSSQSAKGECLVIVAPKQCYVPEEPHRSWGVTAQLYGLSSRRNWGIGDFTDLSMLAEWAGSRLGASTIGINPLHALPEKTISPYSPSSRLFFSPMYLDVEAIPEYRNSPKIQEQVNSQAFQDRLQALRDCRLVDYAAVRSVKFPILEALYVAFCQHHASTGSERDLAFENFIQLQGVALHRFSIFQVLQEQYSQAGWQEWPLEFQNASSSAVEAFAKQHQERVRFYQYVQWQCAEQLSALNTTSRQAGLSLGLYHDLAVGIDSHGADAWMFQEQLAKGVSIGAPPDSFNLSGQNWGLQPPIPSGLRSQGYRFLRETFHHNMQYGGMLRVDHALGLFRLYWIPEGKSGSEGAYVRYPTDELLAILALESVRQRVMVVAEDLGTVTPQIRRKFAQAGLLSYRLLMFEKPHGKGYRTPKRFPEQALASVNTHDLPTLRGFWLGRDIETKEQIGLYPSVSHIAQDRVSRTQDRQALLEALNKQRLLPKGIPSRAEEIPELSDELCQATYAYLARTPCRVVATSLEDLLGEVDTPNVPGAPEGAYPVWQRKLSRPFEEWQHDPDLLEFAAAVHRERATSSSSV
ncbi:MAG: 4-alpha-glucanotransferase [Nitrospirae bacterium]|nr:4-alpha-glucanotransferase [Nitrospirota bacterium]